MNEPPDPTINRTVHPDSEPRFGLVCITRSDEIRFRTITQTRALSLHEDTRTQRLRELYGHNLNVLFRALEFCHARGIGLYRMTSNLFPLADLEDGLGTRVLEEFLGQMAPFAERAAQLGVRVVIHPEQFVVLNSESETVRRNSVANLEHHATILDRLGLPRSNWTATNVHYGKGGRSEELVQAILALPEAVRSRLTLENDEHAYGAESTLEIARAAGVPMVFDAHHHAVRERVDLNDESITRFTRLTAQTWNPASSQIVHLSNGRTGGLDGRHSELISEFPPAFWEAPWIEVEAKGKEEAINGLRENLNLMGMLGTL